MHKDRLLKLAAHLDTVPKKRFNMDEVVSENASTTLCGTRGCAMGHALSIKSFRKLGLKLNSDGSDVRFKDYDGSYEGAEELFDTNSLQAAALFGCSWENKHRYQSPKSVAASIRRFVKTNGEKI